MQLDDILVVHDVLPADGLAIVYAGTPDAGGLEVLGEVAVDEGRQRQAALLAFSAFSELKHVILVDEDVDPFDTNDVLWAMTTRFQADVDVVAIQAADQNKVLSTPNKLFESLAAGVPVVASDFPAMREIVARDPDGPLGALCDPTDPRSIAAALRSVLDVSPEARADLRARCLRAAHERWNWETEGARLAELYAELGATAARRPSPRSGDGKRR